MGEYTCSICGDTIDTNPRDPLNLFGPSQRYSGGLFGGRICFECAGKKDVAERHEELLAERERDDERRHQERLESEEKQQQEAEWRLEEREREDERRHQERLESEERRHRERMGRMDAKSPPETRERSPDIKPTYSSTAQTSNESFRDGGYTDNYLRDNGYEKGTKETLNLILGENLKRSITNIKVQIQTSNLGVSLDLLSETIINELKQFELSMRKYDEATIRQHIEPALLLFRRYDKVNVKMGPFDRGNMVVETEGFLRKRLEELVAEHGARKLRLGAEASAPADTRITAPARNETLVTPAKSSFVMPNDPQNSSLNMVNAVAPRPTRTMYDAPVIRGSLFSDSRRKLQIIFLLLLILGTLFCWQQNIVFMFGIPVSAAIAFWIATWIESRNKMQTIMAIAFLVFFVPGAFVYWEKGGLNRLLGIPFWAAICYGIAYMVEFIIALLKLDETK